MKVKTDTPISPRIISKKNRTHVINFKLKKKTMFGKDSNENKKPTIIVQGDMVTSEGQTGGITAHTVNQYGIQPRKITKEDMDFFEYNCPNKQMYIGFVAPSLDGEIINYKNQIIAALRARGYSNIENTDDIRIIMGSNWPMNKVSIIDNNHGGKSFFIPPAVNVR